MDKLSDNYKYRKCYIKRNQVPTQSVMKKTMRPPLAEVYFKSMNPKHKVLAGLEPPLKGGGVDWFQPPGEILGGRAVLKPVKKKYLQSLSYQSIGLYGEKFVADHHRRMEEFKRKVLEESDKKWKKTVDVSCWQEWDICTQEASLKSTKAIQQAFREFTSLYMTSISRVEQLLYDAAYDEIKAMREEAFDKMSKHYAELLQEQAAMLKHRYTEKLRIENARLKAEFIKMVEESRTDMSNQIHDLRVEKRVLVEKLRHLLESQHMACQIYVALKEREECAKEIERSKHVQKKTMKILKEQLALRDFEVRLEQAKEQNRLEHIKNWHKKVCHVVKKFQMFVSYSLSALPEYADFFIDMEKLMLLQLNETIENPKSESIFQFEDETFHTPVARPHPFYLCCDKGYKPELDQDLCPKHCTSSASQMPVVVVNKRCIYAACDNFHMFKDKIKEFISGARGDDDDYTDFHKYELDVPVKLTSSRQLLDLKLESSLLQVLQNELPNATEVPTECYDCKIPHCFCRQDGTSLKSFIVEHPDLPKKAKSVPAVPLHSLCEIKSRSKELLHEREPKWESYFDYVHPYASICRCANMTKKHLEEHLPPYMRNRSKYEDPDMTDYELCNVATLKRLVKRAQGRRTPPPTPKISPRTYDVSTQYSDQEVDFLCTCFSDNALDTILKELADEFKPATVEVGTSPILRESPSQFAKKCAFGLRGLLDEFPELVEIFKSDCK